MPQMNTEQLKPGMVLADDVLVDQGRKLLSRGTVLNEEHLKSLKSWGIAEVAVGKGDLDSGAHILDPENIDPKQWEVVQEQIRELFSRSNTDSSMVIEMMRLCGVNKLKQNKGMDQ